MSEDTNGLVPPGPSVEPPPPPPPGPAFTPPASGPPPAPSPSPAPAAPSSDKALGWTGLGLTLAFCLPLFPLAGAVVSIVALARKRFRPRWVAVLAVVVGLALTAGQVAAVPGFLDALRDGMNDSLEQKAQEARDSGERREIEPFKLQAGDCLDDPNFGAANPEEAKMTQSVTLVPCDEGHDLEIFATLEVPGDEFPGAAAIDRRLGECLDRFRSFIGVHYGASSYEAYFYYPTKQTWKFLGDREIDCAVGAPGEKVTGSLEGHGRGVPPSPGDEIAVERLIKGDCYSHAGDTLVFKSCSAPHFAEVFAVFEIELAKFPGEPELVRRTVKRCTDRFEEHVGIPFDDSSYEYEYWTANAKSWALGDQISICAVHNADDDPLTGPTRGTRR